MICWAFVITWCAARSIQPASPTASRAVRSMGPSGRKPRRSKPLRERKRYAKTQRRRKSGSGGGRHLRVDPGRKVRLLDDVGRQEIDRSEDLLHVDEEARRARRRRRGDQALQESRRERQADARSQDPPRRRRQLSGAE